MLRKLQYFLLLAFIVFFHACKEDDEKQEPLPQAELTAFQKDYKQLQKIIEDNHPALYNFVAPDAFNEFFEQQYNSIDESTELLDFYKLALETVAKIGCGHSFVSPPDGFYSNLTLNILPFDFYIVNSKIYVTNSIYAEYDNLKGAEIKEIDGVSASEIYKEVKKYISADGYRDSFIELIAARYLKTYYTFRYGSKEKYTIHFETEGSSTSLEINSISYQDALAYYRNLPKIESSPFLDLTINTDEDYALMQIKSFNYRSNFSAFKTYIDTCFTKINESGTSKLIVDIRGNMGGDPACSSYLISHISDKSIRYFPQTYFSYDDLSSPVPPSANYFDGQVVVLIDGECFSTSGHFSALVKHHEIATLVGRETGGTYSCNDGSRSHYLSNSNIHVRMATGTFAVDVTGFTINQGVMPDIEVVPDVFDIIEKRDVVLEKAIAL